MKSTFELYDISSSYPKQWDRVFCVQILHPKSFRLARRFHLTSNAPLAITRFSNEGNSQSSLAQSLTSTNDRNLTVLCQPNY